MGTLPESDPSSSIGRTTSRVSVVVPAYNNADFLAATLDSILAQTYRDFELIVSDHSSSDGTAEVMRRYLSDPRVRLHTQPAGGGAPANWNAVTALATGVYLKLVCGDDLIYPTCLQRQVEALDAHPSAVLTAAQRDIVDAKGEPVLRGRGLSGLRGLTPGRDAIRRTVRAGTNIFGEPASVLFRREALAAAGNWDGRYSYLIDQASYIRVLLTGDCVAVPESLGGFRVSDQQWSVRLMRSQSQEAKNYHLALAREHPDLLSPTDVFVGNRMADANAVARRGAYIALRRRMRASAH
jgi:glycosyltransferase involved in cell wall biosynthesis